MGRVLFTIEPILEVWVRITPDNRIIISSMQRGAVGLIAALTLLLPVNISAEPIKGSESAAVRSTPVVRSKQESTVSITAVTEEKRIQINIQVPQLSTERIVGQDGREYLKLSIPNHHDYSGKAGAPRLPYLRELIQIPDNASNLKVTAEYRGATTIYHDFLLYPSPKMVVKKDPRGFEYVAEQFHIDAHSYDQDVFVPAETAKLREDGYFRSARMLEVHLYPVRYNPGKRILQFHTAIDLKISYQRELHARAIRDTNQHFTGLIQDLVLNPEQVQPLSLQAVPAPTGGTVLHLAAGDLRNRNLNVDYLLVTHSDFEDSSELDAFAAYRANNDLYRVAVVKVEDIYMVFPNTSGSDFSIKDFVQYAYDNWQTAPSYLLLLGDTEWVPTHMDQVYADAQNDDWFAYVSGSDEWADLAVGRLSVRSTQHISNISDKIRHYEQDSIMQGDYHETAVMVSNEGSSGGIIMDIQEKTSNAGYSTNLLAGDYYEIKREEVISAFSANFLYWLGHGTSTFWNLYPAFSIADLPNLNNTYKTPIVMTTSCNTARIIPFGGAAPGSSSFGEALVNLSGKGAVAYYGSTVLTGNSGFTTLITLEEVFDNFEYNIGHAILRAEMRNQPVYSHGHLLIGDPALHAFGHRLTQTQPDLTLSSTDISYDGRTNTLMVKAANIGNVDAVNVPVQVLLYETPQLVHTLAEFTIPRVSAKAVSEFSLTAAPPLRGEFLIVAKLDPQNQIDESYELNNQNGREINTMHYSGVTVLDHKNQPISETLVEAYASDHAYLSSSLTDKQGRAKFYLGAGLPVYFRVVIGDSLPRSYLYSDEITTPQDATITKPEQVSRLTVLNSGHKVTHYRCYAYDLFGRELGLNSFYNPAEEEVSEFYIKDGTQFYFLVTILQSAVHDPGTEFRSGVLTAPANGRINPLDVIPPAKPTGLRVRRR